jgi:hypothetical protein
LQLSSPHQPPAPCQAYFFTLKIQSLVIPWSCNVTTVMQSWSRMILIELI